MKRILTLVLFLFAGQAQAQVYRLYCVGRTACYGSAVCVKYPKNGEQHLLTANHNLLEANRYFIDLPTGRTAVRVVARSKTYDLAVLAVKSPRQLPIYRISPTNKTSGKFVVVGYPDGGKVASTPVTIREGKFDITSRCGNRYLRIPCQIETSTFFIGGESGGAVVSTDGKLVGVISSTDSKNGYASGYTAICDVFGGFGWQICPPQRSYQYQRPTTPIPEPYVESEQPPYVPEEQPVPNPTQDPQYIAGPRGPAGPQGPPGPRGESWDRAIVRGMISDEVREQVSKMPSVPGPRGPQGPAGPAGQRGPAGRDYDPSELESLASRVSALEQSKTVIVESKPEPRVITIYVQELDANGKPTGRTVATPVEVPPTENEVTIPIKRFSGN